MRARLRRGLLVTAGGALQRILCLRGLRFGLLSKSARLLQCLREGDVLQLIAHQPLHQLVRGDIGLSHPVRQPRLRPNRGRRIRVALDVLLGSLQTGDGLPKRAGLLTHLALESVPIHHAQLSRITSGRLARHTGHFTPVLCHAAQQQHISTAYLHGRDVQRVLQRHLTLGGGAIGGAQPDRPWLAGALLAIHGPAKRGQAQIIRCLDGERNGGLRRDRLVRFGLGHRHGRFTIRNHAKRDAQGIGCLHTLRIHGLHDEIHGHGRGPCNGPVARIAALDGGCTDQGSGRITQLHHALQPRCIDRATCVALHGCRGSEVQSKIDPASSQHVSDLWRSGCLPRHIHNRLIARCVGGRLHRQGTPLDRWRRDHTKRECLRVGIACRELDSHAIAFGGDGTLEHAVRLTHQIQFSFAHLTIRAGDDAAHANLQRWIVATNHAHLQRHTDATRDRLGDRCHLDRHARRPLVARPGCERAPKADHAGLGLPHDHRGPHTQHQRAKRGWPCSARQAQVACRLRAIPCLLSLFDHSSGQLARCIDTRSLEVDGTGKLSTQGRFDLFQTNRHTLHGRCVEPCLHDRSSDEMHDRQQSAQQQHASHGPWPAHHLVHQHGTCDRDHGHQQKHGDRPHTLERDRPPVHRCNLVQKRSWHA